jgi:hypothetical protein
VRAFWCAQSARSFVILDAWMCTCAQIAQQAPAGRVRGAMSMRERAPISTFSL